MVFSEADVRPQRGQKCCGLRAQSFNQRKRTQGLRSKMGTRTLSDSPKVTSFTGGRDLNKQQDWQVLEFAAVSYS